MQKFVVSLKYINVYGIVTSIYAVYAEVWTIYIIYSKFTLMCVLKYIFFVLTIAIVYERNCFLVAFLCSPIRRFIRTAYGMGERYNAVELKTCAWDEGNSR